MHIDSAVEEIRSLIREIITSDKDTNKNILYLHGLDSSSKKDGIDDLKSEYGDVINFITPSLDYRDKSKSIWKEVEKVISEKKPVAVIGHSLGGYMTYYVSNKYEIPALMFNPAFKDKDLNLLSKATSLPKEAKELSPYKNQMAVVGSKDDVVSPEDQKKELKNGNAEIFIEEIGHDIPTKILKKYMKMFVEKWIA
jgi:hypothetical protein